MDPKVKDKILNRPRAKEWPNGNRMKPARMTCTAARRGRNLRRRVAATLIVGKEDIDAMREPAARSNTSTRNNRWSTCCRS